MKPELLSNIHKFKSNHKNSKFSRVILFSKQTPDFISEIKLHPYLNLKNNRTHLNRNHISLVFEDSSVLELCKKETIRVEWKYWKALFYSAPHTKVLPTRGMNSSAITYAVP